MLWCSVRWTTMSDRDQNLAWSWIRISFWRENCVVKMEREVQDCLSNWWCLKWLLGIRISAYMGQVETCNLLMSIIWIDIGTVNPGRSWVDCSSWCQCVNTRNVFPDTTSKCRNSLALSFPVLGQHPSGNIFVLKSIELQYSSVTGSIAYTWDADRLIF